MKYMATYDWMESFRNTTEWAGASARAIASYPAFALSVNPMLSLTAAWGEVAERSFGRMSVKPDWGIRSIVGPTGQDHLVDVAVEIAKPFGDLIHFKVRRRAPMKRKLLVVAPMSGHYATLLRSTVTSLLPDAEVYVTDWHNARDIPASAGKFDIEDYTLYLVEFMRHLGPDTHVIAVCQPAPLALAATAYLAGQDPEAQPRSLILIGGPIDPDAAATDVTDFGRRVTMGQLEEMAIQRVGFKYKGAGRLVYPGLLQLAGFISMNAERHSKAFSDQIMRVVHGEASDQDAHNRFYDEYLSVMDMTAEFYLSTVSRIFKNREIAKNEFVVAGKQVDLGAIKRVAVMTVEGEKDDISAPGQCVAALNMLPGLPEAMKAQHLEPGAGHYGIFAGQSWRLNIRPLVLGFIDKHSGAAKPAPAKLAAPAPASAEQHAVFVKSSSLEKPAAKPAEVLVEKPAEKPEQKLAVAAQAAAKPVVKKAAAPKPAAEKPAAKPVEVKPAEVKPAAAKAVEAKPAAVKPVEVKPVEAKPLEAKPVEAAKPAVTAAPVVAKPAPVADKPATPAATTPAPVAATPTTAAPAAATPAAPTPAAPAPVVTTSAPAPAVAQSAPAPVPPAAPQTAPQTTAPAAQAPAATPAAAPNPGNVTPIRQANKG